MRQDEITDPRLRQVIDDQLVELPWGPQEINCAFDKSCNLSCPTCRFERIIETDQADSIIAIQKKLEEQAIPGAEYLYITGSGDAFGSPYFNRWLRTMQLDDKPRLEHIHLHTNAQLWIPRMWDRIPDPVKARIRSAEISIDAARAETYSVNRREGNFDRLLENLEYIRMLRLEGPLERLTISMVVQQNNFREMIEFVGLGKKFAADCVYFSQLVNWGTFDDAEYKQRAVHLPNHPLHSDLKAGLADPVFEDPCVFLGNLTHLVGGDDDFTTPEIHR